MIGLIIFIVIAVLIAIFTGFNLGNVCDVNVIFHTFHKVPVFITIIISFIAGIVVALLRPDLDVTLIETMERRTQWLSDVVEELDLDNVTIRRARAEEIKDRYDVVTARAVANLSKLVRLTAPLLRPGGALLALKGMRAQDEIDDAK